MSKFITLTDLNGNKVVVNTNHIVYYEPVQVIDNPLYSTVTKLAATKEDFSVQETTETIYKKIDSLNKIS